MQISDLEKELNIPALFRLGFRPFFLSGAIFSIIAVTLWLFILKGEVSIQPLGGVYWWHIHEMIFGFAAAIIAGFLLTAIQNWTGVPGLKGTPLIALFTLWLAGRLFILMPDVLGSTITALIDLSFFPVTAYFLAKPIIAIKQYRNLFFVPLLALFTLANAEMHASILYSTVNLQLSGYAGVMLTVFLMSVMAGRVTPIFTANGTQTQKVSPIAWLEKLANGSLAVCMMMLLLHPLVGFSPAIMGSLLTISGISQAVRHFRLRPWITFAVPLLWSLHAALMFIWVGLIVLGISYLLPIFNADYVIVISHVWHILTIGAVAGLILAMISRVSLGHTGRPLTPPKSMSIAFILISMSALVRGFGPVLAPKKLAIFYDISGFFWIIAFALFVWNYAPFLTKQRKDGHPG